MTKRTITAIRRSMRSVVASQPAEWTVEGLQQRIANWEKELQPAPGEEHKTEEQKAEEAGW